MKHFLSRAFRRLITIALFLIFLSTFITPGAVSYASESNSSVPSAVVKDWKKGWHSYNGNRYYCTKNRKLAKGWKTIKKKKYYFDTTSGVMYKNRNTIGNYSYYFSDKGVMQKGWVTFSDGKRYYDSKGRMVVGKVKIKGKKYSFEKCSGLYKDPKSANAFSIPVLTFHRITSDFVKYTSYLGDQWVDSVSDFSGQMQYLYENGYRTITLDEFYQWYKGNLQVDKKTVVLTFDDGDYEFYYLVAPILQRYGFNATMFIIESLTDTTTHKYVDNDERYRLGWDVIERMKSEYPNISIQSHSYDLHHYENGVMAVYSKNPAELEADFSKTNESFEYMAWPYGYFSDSAVQAFKESHYKLAFNFGRYKKATRDDLAWSVYRLKVNGQCTIYEFIEMLN